MADYALQRHNMVESQVRPSDVTDRRIIRAMAAIPREVFVAKAHQPLAYLDAEIAVDVPGVSGGAPRSMLAPRTLAKLLQLAEVEAHDIVLDVGCATGYSAAVLAHLGQTVVALESETGLAQEATRILQSLGADTVAVVQGPLTDGYPSEGPFDVIVIEGAVAAVPDALIGQLKDGGRLVAIVTDGRCGRAAVWRRSGTSVSSREGFDAGAPLLPGFEPKPHFVF